MHLFVATVVGVVVAGFVLLARRIPRGDPDRRRRLGALAVVGAALACGALMVYPSAATLRGQQAVVSLCRTTRAGQPLAAFTARARRLGLRVLSVQLREGGAPRTVAEGGTARFRFFCEVESRDGTIVHARIERAEQASAVTALAGPGSSPAPRP